MKVHKKRVLVVDDQSAICDLISEIIENHPQCELVGKTYDGFNAVRLAKNLQPDILILDVIMPDINGLEVLSRLRNKLPRMKVLIFSGNQEPVIIRSLMRAGIHGFVNKSCLLPELRKAIESLAAGNNWFSMDFTSLLTSALNSADHIGHDVVELLTCRELEIAKLIAQSNSSRVIATKLHISSKTVGNHRANMMRKLGVHDVAGVVRLMINKGYS